MLLNGFATSEHCLSNTNNGHLRVWGLASSRQSTGVLNRSLLLVGTDPPSKATALELLQDANSVRLHKV